MGPGRGAAAPLAASAEPVPAPQLGSGPSSESTLGPGRGSARVAVLGGPEICVRTSTQPGRGPIRAGFAMSPHYRDAARPEAALGAPLLPG